MHYTVLADSERKALFQEVVAVLISRYDLEHSLIAHYMACGANRRESLAQKLKPEGGAAPTYVDLTLAQLMLAIAEQGVDLRVYRFDQSATLFKFVRSAQELPMEHRARIPSLTLNKRQRSDLFRKKAAYLEKRHGVLRRHLARIIAAGANKRMEIDKRLASINSKWVRPPSYANLAVIELMRFLTDEFNVDWRRSSFTIDGRLADMPKKHEPAKTLDVNFVAQ